MERVLLAVDDSPASLAAARVAIEVAGALGAHLRAVHVSADHVLDAALEAASGRSSVVVRRSQAAAAILARVSRLATTAGVPVDVELLTGDVGSTILEAARGWRADLIVMGRATRAVSGQAYVGHQTRHVLEFAEQPVLVVPHDRHG